MLPARLAAAAWRHERQLHAARHVRWHALVSRQATALAGLVERDADVIVVGGGHAGVRSSCRPCQAVPLHGSCKLQPLLRPRQHIKQAACAARQAARQRPRRRAAARARCW